MGTNVFKQCNFAGVRAFKNAAIDEPEPIQPVQPTRPENATAEEQIAYKKDIEKYPDDSKKWSKVYTDWSVNNSRAISEAEGNINGIREKFGQAFDVNITTHLLIFSSFIGIMLLMMIAAQKVKDYL